MPTSLFDKAYRFVDILRKLLSKKGPAVEPAPLVNKKKAAQVADGQGVTQTQGEKNVCARKQSDTSGLPSASLTNTDHV